MQAPIIPASKSDGTRTNKSSFNEATNQYSFHRFSENIAGNIANKVLDIEFDVKTADGRIEIQTVDSLSDEGLGDQT